jgi:hypothetical protein
VSKKDRQHQHIQPITPVLNTQPEKPSPASALDAGEQYAIAVQQELQVQIQRLEAELEKERARANDEYHRAEEAMLKVQDLYTVMTAARHGPPPDGFQPKTQEGKEAIEEVVRIGNIAKEQRHLVAELQLTVDEAAKSLGVSLQNHYGLVEAIQLKEAQRKALHWDLTVIEQTGTGLAIRNTPQTEIGRSALAAVDEVLKALDMLKQQRLEDEPRLSAFASETARQLVEAIPKVEREPLLGDLLAQLLPSTGETGKNETASDVLKRLVAEADVLRGALAEAAKTVDHRRSEFEALSERMVKIQSAMVARRAPDAAAGAALEALATILVRVGRAPAHDGHLVSEVTTIVSEWQGLRTFLSEAPLTAVAIRNDGHKGPVRERFSLLVLSWDGKAVSTKVIDGTRPWGDIAPYLQETVLKHLIPSAYR